MTRRERRLAEAAANAAANAAADSAATTAGTPNLPAPSPVVETPPAPLTRRALREAREAKMAAAPLSPAPTSAAPVAPPAPVGPVTAPITLLSSRTKSAHPETHAPVAPIATAVAAPAAALSGVRVPEATRVATLEARAVEATRASIAIAAAQSDDETRDAEIEQGDVDTDGITLPLSFRRNLEALAPVAAPRRGSKRALVRIKRRPASSSRSSMLRGAAGVTALGFAASIAVATTLPAAANHDVDEAIADEIAMAGTQSFVVGASSSMVAETASTSDRDPVYSVATMGTATAYNSTYGIKRPDPNAYQNDMTAAVQWPFHTGVVISDHYGPRPAPCSGCSSDHKGVDFTPGEGTPIGSIAAGRVITVHTTDNGGLGVYVEVEHIINGERVVSVYGHMLEGSIAVQVGDVVNVGDEVGKVGNTGSSTGAHLHLEIHIGTEKVDPFAFLAAHNVPSTVVERPDASVSA